MPTYRDLLQQVKTRSTRSRRARRQRSPTSPAFVDVRERDEWDEGHIPGALHVPRGNLESRIEQARARPRAARSIVYCAVGARSRVRRADARASSATRASSTSPAASPTGSATASPSQLPRSLDAGAARALQPAPADPRGRRGGPAASCSTSRVLLIGAGGLGSPSVALPRGGGRRHGSGSSTPTSSTRRTSSARCSTRPTALGEPKVALREAHDRGAQPRRRGRHLRGAAHLGERRPDPRRAAGT